MHQITAAQFKTAVELDPAWASKLTEPVEITDYCDMSDSSITHLSHLLHFTGKNHAGDCASFSGCNSLETAEGTFEGFVSFSSSGVRKIGELSCGKDHQGNSAFFWHCDFLKIAEGKFEGRAAFYSSAIEKIGDLSCGKDIWGSRLSIEHCPNLKSIPVRFEPREINADPKLLEKLEVDRFIQKKRTEIMEVEL